MARHSAAARPAPVPPEPADERATGTVRPPDPPAPAPVPEPPRPHRPSPVRLFVAWLGSLVLLGTVALALAVAVVPAAAGGTALTVRSPDMTPTYPVGTLVVTRPRPAEQIRVGDVVAFTDRDPASGAARTVTHRVVAVEPGPLFRTRGDANEAPDPEPVPAGEVRGVAWYSVPVVGGWGALTHTGPGLLVTGGAVLLVVALMLLAPRRGR